MKEHLEKALHDLGFASDELRHAGHTAGCCNSIILLDLIKRAAELRRDVQQFAAAVTADAELIATGKG